MPQVCIGIPVYAEPAGLLATLASLIAYTSHEIEIVLLPDEPDGETTATLSSLSGYKQLRSPKASGTAACFNRLIQRDCDVAVLLESGCQVSPNWLDQILQALDVENGRGLAGPSTNRSWNQQGAFPEGGPTPDEIARTAVKAKQRFQTEVRSLEPLHSLADFCYAVRREVIEAIGAADERYGLGPCWEMDYNIRAARAGFRGVWACAAYVHRAPFTARRKRCEELGFPSSRQLYQQKFCGRQLRGEKSDFRTHCRGDECPNFAPTELMTLKLPWPNSHGTVLPIASRPPTQESDPLVTCIMPTCNRRAFVPLAVRWFERQDYPNLELLVVDDGDDPIQDCLPTDPRIRYIRLEERRSIGAKRNLACAQARGEYIVHWDDDDWSPPWRVRRQVQALTERNVPVCGSSQTLFHDPATGSAWRYQYSGSMPWVVGTTLAYRKSYWKEQAFEDIQIGEDSRFIWGQRARQLYDLADSTLCVGTIHSRNTSRKSMQGSFWQRVPGSTIDETLGDDAAAFRAIFREASPPSAATPSLPTEHLPLISCIMPTFNRRKFVELAIAGFLGQDYPNKELIIVDDGPDAVGDLARGHSQVRYFRQSWRTSIGAKRNFACRQATGTIIAHWDDDDWYASNRLRYQSEPILSGAADLTGLENAFVLELDSGRFWTTRRDLHRRMFEGDVHGGTLMYQTAICGQGVQYPDVNLAEDAALIRNSLRRGFRLTRLENPGVFIYVRHGHNAWRFTAGQFLDPNGWQSTMPPHPFSPAHLMAYQTAALGSL